jgi:hypothetical protein
MCRTGLSERCEPFTLLPTSCGRHVPLRIFRCPRMKWCVRAGADGLSGRLSRPSCNKNCNSPVATRIATGLLVVSSYSSIAYKSGRRDSNPRRPAWEAGILPLNYARVREGRGTINRDIQNCLGRIGLNLLRPVNLTFARSISNIDFEQGLSPLSPSPLGRSVLFDTCPGR